MVKEMTCRHEHIKIFQRKYKGTGRRLVRTRGYLPVGFSTKDLSHLGANSFCFCTNCRLRLYPLRIESTPSALPVNETQTPSVQVEDTLVVNTEQGNNWCEENTGEISLSKAIDREEINVDELQVDCVNVEDIPDKKMIVSEENNCSEENGEE